LKKEHKDQIEQLTKQYETELFSIKNDYTIKLISKDDKIDKMNKEIDTNRKLIAALTKEISELKVKNESIQRENNKVNISIIPQNVPPTIPPPPPNTIFSSLPQAAQPPGPPPPPPPMAEMAPMGLPPPPFFGLPPPPPPPMTGGPPPPPPMMGMPGGPPPPPPMDGHTPGPPPFAPPPAPTAPLTRPISRKKYTSKEEMKVLYWNRIQIFNKSEAIWFDVEEPEDIGDEFASLFSKQQMASKAASSKAKGKAKSSNNKSPSKLESVKLLESKRSQSIGILISSQRLDSQLIRDALINFDNKILNFETLNSIYAIRPLEDEIRCIQDYLKSSSSTTAEENLDKPEIFLLELSRIPAFEERIYCLVYQNKFIESISSIEFRINNMNTICEEMLLSDKIRKILGIILGCGNNMNSSNKARGDADGFDLAILPNLKDVKSKDNTTNLLQFIAGYYVNKFDDDLIKFPLPDPSDFNFVAGINFDEINKEIKKVKMEIGECEKRIEKIMKTMDVPAAPAPATDHNEDTSESSDEPLFKKRVNAFLNKARNECKEQEENFLKCKLKFQKVVAIFCVKPKPSEPEVLPEYFFSLWSTFVLDFKNAWKRETQRIEKERLKAVNEKRNQIRRQSTVHQPVGEKNSIKAFFHQKRNEESKNKN
jgi:hypothetical protein